ncbi:calaxin-like [Porites lutea]|uniref:calaxin-like n=1 Tax=Porites lutea TaxID=51062 RepID=UPI003CC6613D
MGSTIAGKNRAKMAESLWRDTHFTRDEVIGLLGVFEAEAKGEKMDRSKFRDFLHKEFGLTEDIMLDRVFRVFNEENDGNLSMREWIMGLSKIKGTPKEQIDFCFKVYDINGAGYLTREGIQHLLKDCMVKSATEEDADENEKEIVDIVMKKMDEDHDGKISPLDYETAVLKEGCLLIEAFGKCLPDRKIVDEFIQKSMQRMDQQSFNHYQLVSPSQ